MWMIEMPRFLVVYSDIVNFSDINNTNIISVFQFPFTVCTGQQFSGLYPLIKDCMFYIYSYWHTGRESQVPCFNFSVISIVIFCKR